MSELASALFSIADAGEFRFARFYIVCEEVALAPLKSPLIGKLYHQPSYLPFVPNPLYANYEMHLLYYIVLDCLI